MTHILLVGNCDFDNGSLGNLINDTFVASIQFADSIKTAIELASRNPFDLILINRVFDKTGENGVELIRELKSNDQTLSLDAMLVTNFEEHQEHAISLGAKPGFGKSDLQNGVALTRLKECLDDSLLKG